MQDIHDIKEPILLSYNYFPFIMFCLIILLLFFLSLFFWLKKRKVKDIIIKSDNNKSHILLPVKIALFELEKIRDEKLIEQNKYDLFYNKLSDVIKKYLYSQYQIQSEVKTTGEIIKATEVLNRIEFNNQLKICLNNIDIGKYSKGKGTQKLMEKSLDDAFILFKIEDL